MKSISVAELRQNPTDALESVATGETYVITEHRNPIAMIVPYVADPSAIVPPRRPGPTRLREQIQDSTHTTEQVEVLLETMASDR